MSAVNEDSHFDQIPPLDISCCVIWPSHTLQFAGHQFAEHDQRRLLEDDV